jgi:oxygen-independent coproporphyrinogen-3 oxidase
MTNYSNYDVAVMNYPLFEKRISEADFNRFLSEIQQTDLFEAPIYVHIPFCDSLCDFCVYKRLLAQENSGIVEQYVNSLIKEIRLYAAKNNVKNQKIGAVFIGGGTPTVLNEKQLYNLINALATNFNLQNCEITIECNTGSASAAKLKLLKELGVTRISTGIQTFQDNLRKELHIKGDSKSVTEWMELACKYNFKEVSTDIIYGFPNTNVSQVLDDLKQVSRFNLNHLSVYKMTTFAYTKLYNKVRKGELGFPSDKELEEMFYQSHNYLLSNNYVIQSTQEYGRKESRVKFWDLTYDGYGNNFSFGLSSLGYINGYCYQNETKLEKYFEKIDNETVPIEKMSLKITDEQLLERAMVIGFRRGYVLKDLFFDVFGMHMRDVFKTQIDRQIREGYIGETKEKFYLTPKGYYNQGMVSVDYMVSIFRGVSPLKKKMCIGSHLMP